MTNLMIFAMAASVLLASVAMANPSQRSLPSVSSKDLDDYEIKLKSDPQWGA